MVVRALVAVLIACSALLQQASAECISNCEGRPDTATCYLAHPADSSQCIEAECADSKCVRTAQQYIPCDGKEEGEICSFTDFPYIDITSCRNDFGKLPKTDVFRSTCRKVPGSSEDKLQCLIQMTGACIGKKAGQSCHLLPGPGFSRVQSVCTERSEPYTADDIPEIHLHRPSRRHGVELYDNVRIDIERDVYILYIYISIYI